MEVTCVMERKQVDGRQAGPVVLLTSVRRVKSVSTGVFSHAFCSRRRQPVTSLKNSLPRHTAANDTPPSLSKDHGTPLWPRQG